MSDDDLNRVILLAFLGFLSKLIRNYRNNFIQDNSPVRPGCRPTTIWHRLIAGAVQNAFKDEAAVKGKGTHLENNRVVRNPPELPIDTGEGAIDEDDRYRRIRIGKDQQEAADRMGNLAPIDHEDAILDDLETRTDRILVVEAKKLCPQIVAQEKLATGDLARAISSAAQTVLVELNEMIIDGTTPEEQLEFLTNYSSRQDIEHASKAVAVASRALRMAVDR
jgi:hypothetical protein